MVQSMRRELRHPKPVFGILARDMAMVAPTVVVRLDRIRTTDVRACALSAPLRRTHLERLEG
jgi:hypothetical protein